MICRAGRGLEAGRWAGGQGLRVGEREGSVKVCFGPSSQPRLGGVSVLQGESGKGDTLWPMSHGLYNTPDPSEMVTEGRYQPRTP